MHTSVYIAVSLDGYIATPDGGVAWLERIPNPSGSDFGWSAFLSDIDAIVMGRRTYETVLSFGEWPYAKPVFVLSDSLHELPDELSGRVELLRGEAESVTADLGARGYGRLYVDGGVTVQRFLAADRIDELILTRVPVLLGEGIPLFASLPAPLTFRHAGTETFENGLVKSRYVRQR
jgi:dihydrofolate reductase